MIDPRKRIKNIPFGPGDILNYLVFKNSNTVVLHRINECDERKKTKTLNFRLRLANYVADYTVFVGSWMKDLNIWQRKHKYSSVILNGSDSELFNNKRHTEWDGKEAIRIVTHHWGGNWMKGFDIYQKLDKMLTQPKWKNKIHFTYIGNVPPGFVFHNAKHLPPMDAESLANELSSHHIYLTASVNEPGGNHQNEGALCGLPLLYRNSGCLPEYCNGYGVMFEGERDFDIMLESMIVDYSKWQENVYSYPNTAKRTVDEYITQIELMFRNREDIVRHRNLWHNPLFYLLNQIPF
jgi:hypothetical protein